MAEYPLPQDTQKAFLAARASCRNPGLLFERYTAFGSEWKLAGTDKLEALKQVVQTAADAQRDPDYRKLVEQHYRRWREVVRAAGATEDSFFVAQPEWRFVIGLGRESVLETGSTFHRIYGFPYIPGSALKGLTQAWVLWQAADRLGIPVLKPGERPAGGTPIQQLEGLLLTADSDERRRRLANSDSRVKAALPEQLLPDLESEARCYQAIFGTPGGRGRVVFFDAVPIEPPTLKVDVMNPHYGDYYQQKPGVPPADYLSPVPVYFLTVDRGSRFAFAVASNEPDLAKLTRNWLKAALADLGTGGKTSAGYGYWTDLQSLKLKES